MTKHEYFIQYNSIEYSSHDGDPVECRENNKEFFASSHSGKEAVDQLRKANPHKDIFITQITKL